MSLISPPSKNNLWQFKNISSRKAGPILGRSFDDFLFLRTIACVKKNLNFRIQTYLFCQALPSMMIPIFVQASTSSTTEENYMLKCLI